MQWWILGPYLNHSVAFDTVHLSPILSDTLSYLASTGHCVPFLLVPSQPFDFLMSWHLRVQSLTPFSIFIHSLKDAIQSHSFKYYLHAKFLSQLCISSPTPSQNSRLRNLNISTWISIKHVTLNMCKTRPSSSLHCLHLLCLSSPCLLHSTHISLFTCRDYFYPRTFVLAVLSAQIPYPQVPYHDLHPSALHPPPLLCSTFISHSIYCFPTYNRA